MGKNVSKQLDRLTPMKQLYPQTPYLLVRATQLDGKLLFSKYILVINKSSIRYEDCAFQAQKKRLLNSIFGFCGFLLSDQLERVTRLTSLLCKCSSILCVR